MVPVCRPMSKREEDEEMIQEMMTLYQAGDRLTVGASHAVRITARRRTSPVICKALNTIMSGEMGEPAPGADAKSSSVDQLQ